MKHPAIVSLVAGMAIGCAAAPANTTSVVAYSTDFNRAVGYEHETILPEIWAYFDGSRSGLFLPVGGFEGVGGFSGGLYAGSSGDAFLYLDHLPAHNSITIHFDLAIVDSWGADPDHDRPVAPFVVEVRDEFKVRKVFNYWFTREPDSSWSYPGTGLVEPLRNIAFDPAYFDQVYDLNADGFLMDIPTSSPFLVVQFYMRPPAPCGDCLAEIEASSWPPPPRWAIDNLEVVLNSYPTPVPEVSSLASGTALLALMFWTWRSRKWS